ncbi:MAG: hypothetical protein DRI61_17055 [Chloroflexi bacterium]|nr:MAG: hypothetical protein DRI61_17055 [Chloroflexota bacterium]
MADKEKTELAAGKASGESDCYLFPCPFCGGTSVGVWKEDEFSPWAAGCNDCDIPGPNSETRPGACVLWNKRANPFCDNCLEEDCEVSLDGTCRAIRIYLHGRQYYNKDVVR